MFFERRHTLRVRPVPREPIEVQFVAAGLLEIVQAFDISEKGIGVRLETRIDENEVGADVELVITLPGLFPVYAKGVIRRISPKDGYVVGIEFVSPPAKTVKVIQTYIQRRLNARSAESA